MKLLMKLELLIALPCKLEFHQISSWWNFDETLMKLVWTVSATFWWNPDEILMNIWCNWRNYEYFDEIMMNIMEFWRNLKMSWTSDEIGKHLIKHMMTLKHIVAHLMMCSWTNYRTNMNTSWKAGDVVRAGGLKPARLGCRSLQGGFPEGSLSPWLPLRWPVQSHAELLALLGLAMLG